MRLMKDIRNLIPCPSPGVGGYCLTKDPYLFASVSPTLPHSSLAKTSRYINDKVHYTHTMYSANFAINMSLTLFP